MAAGTNESVVEYLKLLPKRNENDGRIALLFSFDYVNLKM